MSSSVLKTATMLNLTSTSVDGYRLTDSRRQGDGAPKFSDTQLRAIATVVCGVLAETQATGQVPLGGEGSATSSSGASPTGEWQLE